MDRKILGIIIGLVVVVGAVVAVSGMNSDKQSTTSSNGMEGMGNMSAMGGSSDTSSGGEDLTNQTEVMMDIKDFDFSKNDIKIKKGTKVTWTNQDSAKHNAFGNDANGPKGELLAQGESYSFTFDTVGTFNYICEPHPYMKGIVTVTE